MPWAGVRLAVTLLTAVPLPGRGRAGEPPDRSAVAAAMSLAPVIGLLLGLAAAGVLELAARVGHTGPLVAAVLAVATLAALTRALHLDGLADLADGLGSRRPAAQALAIMKRSDIGPYGVTTVMLILLVQVTSLARAQSLGRGVIAVIAGAVTARLAMTLACRRGVKPATDTGLGAMVAGTQPLVVPLALTAVAMAAAAAFGWTYLAAIAAGLAVSVALTALAVRRLGGITGDVLGALAEVAMAASLLVTAIR
jgi:adenosylcobinamide-GDP ribazoletransferase